MNEERTCKVCGAPLVRREGERAHNFRRRATCGKECGIQSSRLNRESRQVPCRCLKCEKEFTTYQSEITKGGGKYCSKDCYRARIDSTEIICDECGSPFTVIRNLIARRAAAGSEVRFCSISCVRAFKANWKSCAHCGARFRARKANALFCGRACRGKAQRVTHKKPCALCGTVFEFKIQDNPKYCCEKCRLEGVRLRRRAPVETDDCAQCGQRFELTQTQRLRDAQRRYCSRACHRKAMRERVPFEDTIRTIVFCLNPHCNKPFECFPSVPAKYCSKECMATHWRLPGTLGASHNCAVCERKLERRGGETLGNFRRRLTCSEECRVGIYSLDRDRQSPYPLEWSEGLRRMIRERDNWTCQECGAMENNSRHHVHHIDFDKSHCDPSNLITLCRRCHGRTTNPPSRDYWIDYYTRRMQERLQCEDIAA